MALVVDVQGGVSSAWSNVISFGPKLAAALLIILVGSLLARVVASVLDKVLEPVGFDRAVERGGLKQALARSKYDPSDSIAKLAFWLIFLVSVQLAVGVFGPNPISDLLQGLIAYLPNVLVAMVIIVVAAAIAKAVTDLGSTLLWSVSGGQVMAKGAGIAVLVVGAFAALDQLQIAPRIVTGLWYAILAIVVGSAVVAVGGGGIKTMQRYWERATTKAEERAPQLTQQAQQSASASAGEGGTGRRPTPRPGPRSSRPSRPAGCAATARPARRRDASTGHRAEASRPPTNQPSHTTREVACHQASTPPRAGRAAPWSTRPATSCSG
jgi:Conserved TM helix